MFSGGVQRYPKYCIKAPATIEISELATPKEAAAAPTWEMKYPTSFVSSTMNLCTLAMFGSPMYLGKPIWPTPLHPSRIPKYW